MCHVGRYSIPNEGPVALYSTQYNVLDLYCFVLEISLRMISQCRNMWEFDICHEFYLISAFVGWYIDCKSMHGMIFMKPDSSVVGPVVRSKHWRSYHNCHICCRCKIHLMGARADSGAVTKYNVGTYWQSIVGTYWQSNVGTYWKSNAGTYWQSNVGIYWQSNAGTHWQSNVGTSWESNVGTYWQSNVGTYWQSNVGTYWQSNVGTSALRADISRFEI